MEKILLQKQYEKSSRNERVVIWISRDVRDSLSEICEETGITQQCLADLLLRKAINAVEVVDTAKEE
jgi:hypothetical protein